MDVDEHVCKCGFVVSGCVKGGSLALRVNFSFPLNFWPTLCEVFLMFCFDWNMNNYTLLADKRSEHMMVSVVGGVLSTDQALWQRHSCICIVSHFCCDKTDVKNVWGHKWYNKTYVHYVHWFVNIRSRVLCVGWLRQNKTKSSIFIYIYNLKIQGFGYFAGHMTVPWL